MKAAFLSALLFGAVGVCLATAEQSFTYPKQKPLVSFSAPDDWKPQMKNGSLFVVSPDGGDVIVEVMMMEAGADDEAAALKEARGTVAEDFKRLKLTANDPVKANGLIVTLLGGEGEDRTGPAHINMALIKHPKAERQILFSVIAAQESAKTFANVVGSMFDSIRAAGSTKAAAPGAVQTFAYPAKEKPDFTVDFPAEWKMKTTDEGVYVESDDKLVAMNVIMVSKSDVADAEETLKKKVGSRFTEIVWNGGKEPEVNKDEALGLTATFQNAQASDGEGTEKYSVNLVTYVRKSGDHALILLAQNPLRALSKHADAMEAVVRSIKVR